MKATHFYWPSSQGCLGCIHAEAGSESSVTCTAAHETPDCELRKYDLTGEENVEILIAELEDPRNQQYPDLIQEMERRLAMAADEELEVVSEYPVDESQTVSNAGNATLYKLDEESSVLVVIWNERAEEHEPESITVSVIRDEE